MAADVWPGGHGVDYFVGDVLGVGCGKTDAEVRGYIGHTGKKLRKVNRLSLRLIQVTVHVLAKERDLLVALAVDVAGLADN